MALPDGPSIGEVQIIRPARNDGSRLAPASVNCESKRERAF
jgi:hypothetical protein